MEKVFSRGLRTVADFDTGNPDIAAFNSQELTFLRPAEAFEVRRALHLGLFYDYYLRSTKVGLRDVYDKRKCVLKNCRCVLFWGQVERNPFLLANPNRKGFVGRDLMMRFPFEVKFSPLTKTSSVRLA